jgi:site-specific recombinase XerD
MMRKEVPEIAEESETVEILQEVLDRTTASLEPITPERALEWYLEDKARDNQQSTVRSHRSRLGFFVTWCNERGIENMNNLTARDLHAYRVWRREDLNVVSEKTQMDTLRVFVQWCETIDAVETGLSRKVRSPTIPDGEEARETTIHIDRAREILDYLEKYEYATLAHVAWLILSETGVRMGTARALDVEDYRPDAETPHVNVVHRPETGTPIKNRNHGERPVGIPTGACDVIDDYLDHKHPDVTDEHGREPLLATEYGRVAKSTIRKYIYGWSRPCAVGESCPHDQDPDDCEAVVNRDRASKCPSSATPHPIRRGYITHLLRSGVPVEVVGARCNVSPAIIEQHYDVRSEADKMRQRQQILNDVQFDRSHSS